jgi:hypothetical protein
MYKRSLIKVCLLVFVLPAFFLALVGCGGNRVPVPKKVTAHGKEKIAVVGFSAALGENDTPQVVRDPLSGAVFWAEPVPPAVVRELTKELFDRLKAQGDRDLLSPGQAAGAYASIDSGDTELALPEAKMLQKIGKALDADLVLTGFVYQWRERQGSAYAVTRAASVTFDLHLVRSADGKVIWNGKFDKTQRPLSENILDLKTFLGGKGRWMTAEKLASLGLDRLLAEMP